MYIHVYYVSHGNGVIPSTSMFSVASNLVFRRIFFLDIVTVAVLDILEVNKPSSDI